MCMQWAELISAYIDGQLDEEQTDELEKHLQQCKVSKARFEQYNRIKEMMASDRHTCPADIASMVMANAERNNLLDGLDLLARPASPLWVKFLKVASAAAMIGLAVSTIFVVTHFTAREKSYNVNVLPPPPRHKAPSILYRKAHRNTFSENLPQKKFATEQPQLLQQQSKLKEAKKIFKSPVAKLAVRPTYKSYDFTGSSPKSLTKIVPWKIAICADMPVLMLIKEQLTEFLVSEKILPIERLEVEKTIRHKRSWFYSAKYYEISDDSHYAEILILARSDKVRKIYAELLAEQMDNAKLTMSKPLENFLKSKHNEDNKILADYGNIIDKIADYFSLGLSPRARVTTTSVATSSAVTTTQAQATTRNTNAQLIPILIVLQKERHIITATTQTTKPTFKLLKRTLTTTKPK